MALEALGSRNRLATDGEFRSGLRRNHQGNVIGSRSGYERESSIEI